MSTGQDPALAHRANLNIASAVVAKLGAGASDIMIDRVTNDVRASHPVAELASAGGMAVVLGAVEVSIARNTEISRPFNLTDSRAAQLATQATPGSHWQHEGALSRYGLLLGSRGNREAFNEDGGGSGGSGSGSAMRGSGNEPAGSAFWATAKGMVITRAYANDNDMGWAPSDLMKMGRPALQALKASGLKRDGYNALRQPSGLNFDNDTIVHGAGFMKRNHLNYDEAGKAAGKLYQHPSLKDADRKEVKGATEQAAKANNKAEDEAAKARIGRAQTRIRKDCPEAAKEVDDWAKKYGADKGAGLDAKAKAKNDDAKAVAQMAQGKAAQQRQDAIKSKLLGMYN